MFNDDWAASLPLYPPSSRTKPPVTLLVTAVGENIFFDPSKEELAVADGVLAVSISSDPLSPGAEADIKVLAIRTIDPPSRVSASAAGAEEAEVGVWQAKRGGLGRKAVARMVRMVTEKGGVGEEILAGMEAFVG